MKNKLVGIMSIVSVLVLLLFSVAGAATIGPFSDSITVQATNWSDVLTFPQFDPTLGTLTSIMITLEAEVLGDASYESLDAAPATITLDLAAEVVLSLPDSTPLLTVDAVAQVIENASAFDGTIDFDGTSGSFFDNLGGTDSDSTSIGPLADFIGVGTVDLPVAATGESSGSGAGNLLTQFSTEAGAVGEIVYTFRPPTVPEPAAMLLIGAGLIGLAGFGRRLRKR